MDKLRALVLKYKGIILYLSFGVLTTVVSLGLYYLFQEVLCYSATVSNVISWVGAVLFAFLTNKPFVFGSHDWSLETLIPELTKFVGGRLASGLFETVFLFITVDLLSLHSMLMKLIASIFVVIANYVISKLFVFRNKNEGQ